MVRKMASELDASTFKMIEEITKDINPSLSQNEIGDIEELLKEYFRQYIKDVSPVLLKRSIRKAIPELKKVISEKVEELMEQELPKEEIVKAAVESVQESLDKIKPLTPPEKAVKQPTARTPLFKGTKLVFGLGALFLFMMGFVIALFLKRGD